MRQMDYLNQLHERFDGNAKRIAELRKEIEALEVEQHEIGIAEKVFASLIVGPKAPPPKANSIGAQLSELFPIAPKIQHPDERLSVKKLILNELSKVSHATKMDIVSRLYAIGHKVNATTVGSTLSKMVGIEVEKAGPLAYRLKGESPAATGLSGASETSPGSE